MIIAQLKKDENGNLRGQLVTLTMNAPLVFRPNERGAAFSVFIEGAAPSEVGAAWLKKSDDKTFYSVRLDDPAFPHPLSCALFESTHENETFNLVFTRPKRQGDESEGND
ncbi:conserved protein [Tepidicaulis marinus]|uniref:Conserved protein n=1 Tax=Tepidicaulis marinus TaxID=1333998 RepID=A0A081BF31_9HYPH|nr:DUF736 domain-containing protein [Tepidicaulis marinus]GAK46649.1 conserved protein [Tepidicaulis marinus]